jgi:hypothetical protein
MTPDELRAAVLVEQYTQTSRAETGRVLAAWTHADHVRHIADALDISIGQASRILAETRRTIIDDLPPSRGRTLVVRGRS